MTQQIEPVSEAALNVYSRLLAEHEASPQSLLAQHKRQTWEIKHGRFLVAEIRALRARVAELESEVRIIDMDTQDGFETLIAQGLIG